MRITKFKIHNFKPMMHHGKTKIESAITSDVLVIIGVNGSGKSMLTYELNPYAAIKPMYTKNGFKQLYIEHNNINYILTSDFRKTKVHSFLKDNVELNLSANSQIQNELVEKEFNLNSTYNNILNFKIKLTSLTRTKRKELMFKSYPDDIDFVLQKYKTILSLVRDCKANIKLLERRKLSIQELLLSKDNIKHLKKLKKTILDGNKLFDKIIFVCDNEINNCKLKQVELDEAYSTEYIDELNSRHTNINKALDKLTLRGDKQSIAIGKETYVNKIEHNNSNQQRLITEGVSIKEEIDKYESYLDSNVDEETKEIKQQILEVNKSIKRIKIDNTIPVLSEVELENLKNNYYPLIISIVDVLHSSDRILSSKSIVKCSYKINEYRNLINSANHQYNENIDKLKILYSKLDRENNSSYNRNCKLSCKLKQNKEESINLLKGYIEGLELENKEINKKIESNTNKMNKLNMLAEYSTIHSRIIEQIETIFSRVTWAKYIVNDRNIIFTLNNDSTNIVNKLNKLIKNNTNHYKLVKLKHNLENYNTRLKTLDSLKLPANDLISKTLLDKETQLRKIRKDYEYLNKQKERHTKDLEEHNKLLDIIETVETDHSNITNICEYMELEVIKGSHEKIKDTCCNQKDILTERLVSIENTLQEQIQHTTILNNEIIPTLKDVNKKYIEYSLLEKGLSPNTGLPKQYMVMFINSILEQVNKYISLVWSYEMKLELLNNSSDLTFDFKVKINNTYVKDISMLSSAQKEMVDFAFILTLYNVFNLNKYPLKLDEIESGFSEGHRLKLLEFLGNIMRSGQVDMLIFINHHAQLYSCFANSQTIALSENDIILPNNYNENVILE